jgi:phosphatidylserine/phosphatidylglycerophosphate/cardiolipin synthase-like enzyme
MDSHPNLEVRIFNPFSRNVSRTSQFVTRLGSVTRRMHNKSFTVDNQVTILGGRNIGSEYFDANPDLAFADLDVMAVGPVAKEVFAVFDRYWYIQQLAFRLELKKDQDGYERLYWHGWEDGKEVVYTHEPYTGFWRRFGINFMSIWPIESQL